MSLASEYSKSLEGRWHIRLRTIHPDGDNLDGVVTGIKRRFIVLREEKDFEFDGVVVLPKKVIRGYRDGRFEQCANRIIRANGEVKKARGPGWLEKCESLQDVLRGLKRRDIWPAVEILSGDKSRKESAFYLGPITEVSSKSFVLRCYDAAGQWEKEYDLCVSEIFKVEFDSAYCTHFNRYMRGL